MVVLSAGLAAGCGGGAGAPQATHTAPLLAGARPVGPGPRFQPPLRQGPVPDCRPGPLGPRFGAHLELFGEGLVVIFPAGIGTRPPRERLAARIAKARCFGPVVTIDPTGLVLLRPGTRATVGDVFALWGQPLGPRMAASFRGRLRAWVNGRRHRGPVTEIPLGHHDEIVLEAGPYVLPHAKYTFPPPY